MPVQKPRKVGRPKMAKGEEARLCLFASMPKTSRKSYQRPRPTSKPYQNGLAPLCMPDLKPESSNHKRNMKK